MPHSGRSVNSTQYRQTRNEVGGSPAGVMESKQIWWKMQKLQIRAKLGRFLRALFDPSASKSGAASLRRSIFICNNIQTVISIYPAGLSNRPGSGKRGENGLHVRLSLIHISEPTRQA